jgi:hypothetical protein
MRLELEMLPHPIPTAEQSQMAFRRILMPRRAMSAVEPIDGLGPRNPARYADRAVASLSSGTSPQP